MLLTATAVGVAAVSILLALFVFLRNSHSGYNVSFAAFAVLLGIWIPANYFGSYQTGNGSHFSFLFFTDFTVAPILAFVFSMFGLQAIRFYHRKTVKINPFLLATIASLAVFFSLGAALHKVSLPIYTHSNVLNTKGVLYTPYNLFVEALVLSGLLTLFYSTIHAKKEYRKQTRLTLSGLLIGSSMLVVANIVFPQIRLAQTLSYFAVLIMLFSLSYSIIRYRLFDIRLIVARSVGYILVIGTFAAAIALSTLLLSDIFFKQDQISTAARAIYILLALLMAFAFQPLKRSFDRLTNKIFYRDAYEPQEVLDKISSFLVGTVDLKRIEEKTGQVLAATVKTASVSFLLKSGGKSEDIELFHLLTETHSEVIVFDELSQVSKHHLNQVMNARKIAIAIRLKTTEGNLGFMLLGFKQSGAPYSAADIKLLGTAADEIAIGLQSALRFDEIQHFNVTLQEKIEEATRQLRHANHRLKELDQTKDEFISMASHQLRTPLTTIKGYLSMVLEGDVGPVTKNEKQMIQQAFDSAERMVFLISDLLNVSRLQSGKFVIENKPTDLSKMVEAEVAQLKDTAEHHQLKLTFKKPDKFPTLNLDETKIRQVIMNFLDNAIYYTPAGGSIEVELGLTDESVTYTATDTGLGVPKAEQHHLFSKFYRAGNARKMRPDGTGLGLFMAKKVIVAQGGSIIFKSEEGKGSTFGFSFPRHKVEIKGKTPAKPAAEAVPA